MKLTWLHPKIFQCFAKALGVAFVRDTQANHFSKNTANIFLSTSISNEDNITSSFTQQRIF